MEGNINVRTGTARGPGAKVKGWVSEFHFGRIGRIGPGLVQTKSGNLLSFSGLRISVLS